MPNLGTFTPSFRTEATFSRADSSGSISVHQELLVAALQFNQADEVWVVPDSLEAVSPDAMRQMQMSVDQLPGTLGARIHGRSLDWLAAHAGPQLIAIGKPMDFPEWAYLRACSRNGFPITSIVHAILFPKATTALAAILMQHQAGDIFVATSQAARNAMSALLQQTAENIAGAFPSLRAEEITLPEITLLPLGINDDFLQPVDKAFARKSLGLPESAIVLLFVGRFSERFKADLEPLFHALHILWSRFPSLHLVLAGSTFRPAVRNNLEQLKHIPDAAGRIHLIQNFPHVLKKAIYAASDIFVSPVDNIQESFGLSILEAMASGLPVVASNWSGYRDLVLERETGFLIDTSIDSSAWEGADRLVGCSAPPSTEYHLAKRTVVDVDQLVHSIAELAENGDMRGSFGDAAKARIANEYVWSKLVRRYGEMWRRQLQLCGESKSRTIKPLALRRAFENYSNQWGSTGPNPLVTASHEALEDHKRAFPANHKARAVLQRCHESPQPLSSLTDGNPRMSGTVYGLIKKGYLKFLNRKEIKSQ